MRRNKFLLSIALTCAAGIAVPAAAEEFANCVEREVPAGALVEMRLAPGAYALEGQAEEKVRVCWQTRTPEQEKKVKIDLQAHGSRAFLRTRGPKNNFRVRIVLPARADLDVRLSAGELRIEAVEGNKDVRMLAGELSIGMRESEYSRVDAAVRAGEISARALGVSKGGLFRSLKWQGRGPYALYARVSAGELRLGSPSQRAEAQ